MEEEGVYSEELELYLFCAYINAYIELYDTEGLKEYLGNTSHRTWINSLKAFKIFLIEEQKTTMHYGLFLYEKRNYSRAIEFYEYSANIGNSLAMYKLGSMFFYGDGTDRNNSEAIKWYQRAASLKNTYAMFTLGQMYALGQGVIQDSNKAFEWYSKAIKTPLFEYNYD